MLTNRLRIHPSVNGLDIQALTMELHIPRQIVCCAIGEKCFHDITVSNPVTVKDLYLHLQICPFYCYSL